jgi:hypothetical protein
MTQLQGHVPVIYFLWRPHLLHILSSPNNAIILCTHREINSFIRLEPPRSNCFCKTLRDKLRGILYWSPRCFLIQSGWQSRLAIILLFEMPEHPDQILTSSRHFMKLI